MRAYAVAVAVLGSALAPIAADAHAQESPDTLRADTIAPAATASQAATAGPEVEDVQFIGVEAFPAEQLAAVVATRESECRSPLYALFCAIGDFDFAERKAFLDSAVLARDEERIRRFYATRGYPDTEVNARVPPADGGDVEVRFVIVEGRPIRVASIRIVGLDRLDPPITLPDVLPLAAGEPYSLVALEATREVIRRAFAERGHPFAEIEVRGEVEAGRADAVGATEEAGATDAGGQMARVVLEAHPGPAAVFGPISIEAEPPIEADEVRERLAYEPGQPYRLSALELTEAWLERLAIVESAAVGPAVESEQDTTVRTRVVVTATRERGLGIEGTVSSTDCLAVMGLWRNRHVFGGPRVLTLSAGVSNLFAEQAGGGFPCTSAGEGEFAELNYFLRADLLEPLAVDPYTVGILGAFMRRQSAPSTFIRRGYGARIGLSRMITDRLTASAIYEPSRNELDAAGIFFCGNYGICDSEGIERLAGGNWLAPLQLRLFRGARGTFGPLGPGAARPPWLPIPVRARFWTRLTFDLAHGWTGSDFDYGLGTLQTGLTRVLGSRFELAGRVRLGGLASGDVVPPRVRLYSGGVNSVRGIPQNLLGPKVLVADSGELEDLGCQPQPGGCPDDVVVDPDGVRVRPLGGDYVIEANVEGRVRFSERLQFAAFIDFGAIARDPPGSAGNLPFPIDESTAVITPGVGIRFGTGFGLMRVDVGYDPRGSQIVPLFTEVDGMPVFLGPVTLARYGNSDDGFDEFWDRLQLHVAIGQPF